MHDSASRGPRGVLGDNTEKTSLLLLALLHTLELL